MAKYKPAKIVIGLMLLLTGCGVPNLEAPVLTGPVNDAFVALQTNRTEDFLKALEAGADVNTKGTMMKWTLLHQAAAKGNLTAVKAILKKGVADINDQDNITKKTVLHCISDLYTQEDMAKSYKATIAFYREQWADDPELETKLAAIPKSSENPADYPDPAEIAKLIVAAGADPNKMDFGNATPLHRAIYKKNSKLVKVLLDAKADPEIRHGMFQMDQFPTALHVAAMMDDAKSIRYLIEAGADKDATMEEYKVDAASMKLYGIDDDDVIRIQVSNTPLSLAKVLGKEEAVKALSE